MRGSRDVSGKREEVEKGRDQREGEFRNAMSGLVRPAEIRVLIWRVSSPLYDLLCYTASPPSLARCRLVVVVPVTVVVVVVENNPLIPRVLAENGLTNGSSTFSSPRNKRGMTKVRFSFSPLASELPALQLRTFTLV